MPRILLLLPTGSYRAPEFLEAARRMGAAVTVASEVPNVLAGENPDGYLALDPADPEAAALAALDFTRRVPLDAVVGADDMTAVAAAVIARSLGLPGNPPWAARAAADKRLMRARLSSAGVPVPAWRELRAGVDPEAVAETLRYPCVLKPAALSGSRGVIRADSPSAFVKAYGRVSALLAREEAGDAMLVEDYVPGPEFALEGLVEDGRLRVLALFDKDPLEGPFFEETLYIRPSALPEELQARLTDCAQAAVSALGIDAGPVHAELRLNDRGPWLIEAASRPIGGRCSRVLRFGAGLSLEELVLRQALGLPTRGLLADPRPSGVLMIPVPGAGTLRRVGGVESARAVPGVEEVLITAHPGGAFIPFPEGSPYPGFIFARGESHAEVRSALREAHARLSFELDPLPADAVPERGCAASAAAA